MARKPKEPLKYPGVREKDGRFTYRYSIPGTSKTGRKQKETPSFPTAKQAYEAGIRIKAELLNGVYFEEKTYYLMILLLSGLLCTQHQEK